MDTFSLLAKRQCLPANAPPPDTTDRASDRMTFDWGHWAAQAADGSSREDRARIAHAFQNALNWPNYSFNLSVYAPEACLQIPRAAIEEWAGLRAAQANDKVPLGRIDLPNGLRQLPAWLQEVPELDILEAQDFKGDVQLSRDVAKIWCPRLISTQLKPSIPTSSAEACVAAVVAWSSLQTGESPEVAKARSVVASHLFQMMRGDPRVLTLPASAGPALDQLDPALMKACIEAAQANGNHTLERIEAVGLQRLPKWLEVCPDLTRLKLTRFVGTEIDLRPLPRSVFLQLDGSEQEVHVHSFGSSVAKLSGDPLYTHHIYTAGDPSQKAHTILRSGQTNSNGVTTHLTSWLDPGREEPREIVCADLATWVLMQWSSQVAVAGTDEFLQLLNTPASIRRTLKPSIVDLHFNLCELMPKGELMSRARWGEYVAQRFQEMADGQSEEFMVNSVMHSMAMQLWKTAIGLTMKFYDPNRTVKLEQRCVHPDQMNEIVKWGFDSSLLQWNAEQHYFNNPEHHFDADGPDPSVLLIPVPKDALALCAKAAPAHRDLSFEFGPKSFADCHVSVIRHIMYGKYMNSLERLKSEFDRGSISVARLAEMLQWRDSDNWSAASYKGMWPEAAPLIDELLARAGL